MTQNKKYNITIKACFLGYIVQAIINNFLPLLFLTFEKDYAIPLSQITLLITFNFGVQLCVDLLAGLFVDKIGYRTSMVLAHIFATIGLAGLTFLPAMFSNPFLGLLICVMIYAIGGGLLEVLVSPVMESCPTDNKEKAMSMLHSFYCWGHVGVVVVSTIFFQTIGISHWKILAILFALVPTANAFIFLKAPIAPLMEEGEKGMSFFELFKEKAFWILIFMMIASGASEQAVSQWASVFAEQGLGVTKAIGDLAGPLSFAVLMGISRAYYGKRGEKLSLDKFMYGSAVLCIFSYLLIVFAPLPILSLLGCAICGLSVGIMWPCTFSKAAVMLRRGGTAMFALLALAGDVGCSGGPTIVGLVSSAFRDDLKKGIFVAILFPVVMILGLYFCHKITKKKL